MDKYLGYCLIAMLLPVTRLLGIVLRRDHRLQQPPQHLLFIKLMGLGSLVVASEAIQTVRQKFPTARFVLLTDANIARGIEPFKVFDEIWTVDTSNLLNTLATSSRFLIKSWRLKNLWVADLEVYSKLTTVYALLTLSLNRFGFHLRAVFFRKYLNTHNILFQQAALLEDNYQQMAKEITGNVLPVQPEQPWPVRKYEWHKPYILLNNTCSSLAPARKLPDAIFATLCKWVLEHTHYKLALTGADNDKNSIDQFIKQYIPNQKDKVFNIAGLFDFGALYQFMSNQCVCLVTIDSGPLHIARKLGLPTVSIWGPTNPVNYLKIPAGYEKRHLLVYNKVSCSPCVHHYEKLPCGGNNTCMKNTSPESIIEKLNGLLNHLKEEKEFVYKIHLLNQIPPVVLK